MRCCNGCLIAAPEPAMKKVAFLIVAFALMVTGIEALRILAAWWQAGQPPPSMAEILSLAALALVGIVWWRHSVFTCRDGQCRVRPPEAEAGAGQEKATKNYPAKR